MSEVEINLAATSRAATKSEMFSAQLSLYGIDTGLRADDTVSRRNRPAVSEELSLLNHLRDFRWNHLLPSVVAGPQFCQARRVAEFASTQDDSR